MFNLFKSLRKSKVAEENNFEKSTITVITAEIKDEKTKERFERIYNKFNGIK